MLLRKLALGISITLLGAVLLYGIILHLLPILQKQLSMTRDAAIGWREDFTRLPKGKKVILPAGWLLKKKPGTRPAIFSVQTDPEKKRFFLHMEADSASASVITEVVGIDLKKTPILRWRWRSTSVPAGADGRIKSKDDQSIGLYVGAGDGAAKKSVSYRWDTLTPKGSEGKCAYGLGLIKIKWYTLRNKEDAANDQWFTEERNVARDFNDAWKFYPDKLYLSVSCNSQYTNSHAAADLEWVEFVAEESK